MKPRIAITTIALILYVGLFNLYIYKFLDWTPYFDKLFYNWLTFGAILFALIDWKIGFVNKHHINFNLLLWLSVLINYLLIMLTVTEVFTSKNPQYMFYSYDLTILLTTITIFFNELKYKILGDPD